MQGGDQGRRRQCKHCGSRVPPEKPSHGGTCPYCREDIYPEAVRCKHCRSDLLNSEKDGCGCGSASQRVPSLAEDGGQPSWPYIGREMPGRPDRSSVPPGDVFGPGNVIVSRERACGEWHLRDVRWSSDFGCAWAERECCDLVQWCTWPPGPDMRCRWVPDNCRSDFSHPTCVSKP